MPCPVARWIAFRPPPGGERDPALAAALRSLAVVETGLPLLQVEEHRDEVIAKLDLRPDVARYRSGGLEALHVRGPDVVVPFTDVTRPLGPRRSAMHAEDGILVLAGPGIRRGAALDPSDLVNLAPTLLGVAGLPVPEHLDGRPLDVLA